MCIENFYIGFLIFADMVLVVLLIISQIAFRKNEREFKNIMRGNRANINQLNQKKW